MSKEPSMTEEMASSFKVGKNLHEASEYNTPPNTMPKVNRTAERGAQLA